MGLMRTFLKGIRGRGSRIFLAAGILLVGMFLKLPTTQAAILSLGPNSGTFTVGSTFDVSVFLNTENQSDNVVIASISFPPDKLQLVSPSTGKSIIEVWTAAPTFNDQNGTIFLEGGIPGGINVSEALITRLTFRVKNVGTALVKFSDQSRVLLNNGNGTDALSNTVNGIYNLILPPPAGPVVTSETHPDQSLWYTNPNVVLRWEDLPGVSGYSYILSSNPGDAPDNIVDGVSTGVVYRNLPDGTHYFHIKALRNGTWGGITHFAISIDTSPPADFPISISPAARTSSKVPLISFSTTDAFSGLDHYEYELIPLDQKNLSGSSKPLFIEAQSPQILNLNLGSYDVVVRAYDRAGNYREVTQRLQIVTPFFEVITDKGLNFFNLAIIPWVWVWIIALILILLLFLIYRLILVWHHRMDLKLTNKEMPIHLKDQLKELQKYRQKYGKLAILLLAITAMLLGLSHPVRAQNVALSPPFVSTVSKNISNEEIFYIGGRTDTPNEEVIIYLQNLQTGETLSENVTSDQEGGWFYRHSAFLTTGNYLLWTQAKIGDQMSPPSPQLQMMVTPTAIQFGSSRLSYETIYLFIALAFGVVILVLLLFIIIHTVKGRKKQERFLKEVREAEASIGRGFAVLRRDIEAELEIIKRAKLNKELSTEEKEKEIQMLNDLKSIEGRIGEELWDIEKMGRLG